MRGYDALPPAGPIDSGPGPALNSPGNSEKPSGSEPEEIQLPQARLRARPTQPVNRLRQANKPEDKRSAAIERGATQPRVPARAEAAVAQRVPQPVFPSVAREPSLSDNLVKITPKWPTSAGSMVDLKNAPKQSSEPQPSMLRRMLTPVGSKISQWSR